MEAPDGYKYWHGYAPWLYHSVALLQMEGRTPSLDVYEAAQGGRARLLTASDTWPVRERADAGGPRAAVFSVDVALPDAKAPVVEFAEGGLGEAKYASTVTFAAQVLRARCLRKESELAVVKLDDGVVLADLKERGVRHAPFALRSKGAASHKRHKSHALACQPKGTFAAFSDFGAGTDMEAQGIHLWDVAAAPPHRPTPAYSSAGKVEDICYSEHDGETLYCVSDGYVRVLDVRAPGPAAKEFVAPFSAPQRCVAASRADANILITGGRDLGVRDERKRGAVLLWDLRMARGHLAEFDHGGADVSHVAPHPTDAALFASATDGQVWIWDLYLSTAAGEAEASRDHLPPELVFVHPTHQPHAVTGLAWVPSQQHTLASTDTTGALHLYSPSVLHADDEEVQMRKAHSLTTPSGALRKQ
eukprot:TRINITY_DN17995_c0_g1_i1.p1 TRINITY_DN17995_c0_g1~~TRINITY_DN17995_c0_g1_i1.p1  ORF type:complete len:418 (+),score=104.31 TRINITY_DN17995_c0_g1_i1:78-1331(+)